MKSHSESAIVEIQDVGDAADLVKSINTSSQVLLEIAEIRERGDIPTARQTQAWKRELNCDQTPICERTCGKCRTKAHRTSEYHRSITNEEFEAVKAHFIEIGKPMTRGAAQRYVHETLRRRNVSYEGDTKLCVRMSREDLEEIKAEVAKAGLSLQEFGLIALAIADPKMVSAVARKVRVDGD